jgi:hypothetical protein
MLLWNVIFEEFVGCVSSLEVVPLSLVQSLPLEQAIMGK